MREIDKHLYDHPNDKSRPVLVYCRKDFGRGGEVTDKFNSMEEAKEFFTTEFGPDGSAILPEDDRATIFANTRDPALDRPTVFRREKIKT